MDKTALVAIITGICSITTAVVTTIIAPLALKKKEKMVEKRKSTAIRWLIAMGLVIGAALGYLLAIHVISLSCLPLAPASATITFPTPESKVPRTIAIQGTSCNIQNGQKLWVLLKPDRDIHYYPDRDQIIISSDGKWSAQLTIGPQNPDGEEFELLTILTNPKSTVIIQRAASDPSFSGLKTLPNSIDISDQVHVILR